MKVYLHGNELHMFPMEKVNGRWKGYYMDKGGNIFSARGTGAALKQLMGSKQSYSVVRYFTLDGMSYKQSHLVTTCKVHRDFDMETSIPTVTGVKTAAMPASATSNDRNHATSVAQALASNGAMIASVVGDKFVFGTNPVIHTTEASLKSEMSRLAALNPGVRFVAFKIASSVVSGGVVWS